MGDSAGMNEDEVLRQRLIVKETTFKKCFKRFVSLRSAIANEDLELCKEIGRDLVKDIEFWDLALGKAAVVSECNAREVQEYATLLNQIGESIEQAQGEVEDLKRQLNVERVARQNKEEYETIARLINEFPARDQLEEDLGMLNNDINRLEQEGAAVAKKMDLRGKQFHLLLHTVQDLQNSPEDEEEQERAAMEEDEPAAAQDKQAGAGEDVEMADPV